MPGSLLRDRQFQLALAAALPVWAMLALWLPLDAGRVLRAPPELLRLALLYPVLEEIVFRGGLLPLLRRRLTQRWGPVTLANLLSSLAFAALHLWQHPPLWAAAVLLPSLVFGYFYERHRSLAAPILLHVFYNAGYFLLFGA